MPKQEGKEQEEWAQELVVLFGDRGNARPVERLREDRWPSQPGIFESRQYSRHSWWESHDFDDAGGRAQALRRTNG
jgi:hypothetical protein